MMFKTHFDLINSVFNRQKVGIDLIEYLHDNYSLDRNTIFDILEELDRFSTSESYNSGYDTERKSKSKLDQNFAELDFLERYLHVLLRGHKNPHEFEQFFVKPITKQQLTLLKENFHKGPRSFAIMIALLSEHKYISLQSREFSKYMRSWYKYLKCKLPKNDNFYGTRRYLEPKPNNPYHFKSLSDPFFHRKKEWFENIFMKS